METRPQHRRLVAGTRPATTLSPVAYITTDFIGCAPILYQYMSEMLRQTTEEHFRYLYDEINWNARLIGIVGLRGVGKSTMIKQHTPRH